MVRALVRCGVIYAVAGFCFAAAPAVAAETRIALVIGVGSYAAPIKALRNPIGDAKFVADALRAENFKVEVLTDPGRGELLESLTKFTQESAKADAAIIYYAGHGVEVDGVNYLLPKDIKPPNGDPNAPAGASDGDVTRAMKEIFTDNAIKATRARDAVVGASHVRLLVLDACRDDPLSSGGERGLSATRGLARETGGSATRVVTLLAAAPGKSAYDGQGTPHSPFAQALVDAIQRPGMTIGDLPLAVQSAVEDATRQLGEVQSPDLQGIFRDSRWAFSGSVTSSGGATAPDAEAAAQVRLAREQAFWQTARNSNDPADLKAYLDKVASGEFSGLFETLARNRMRALEASAAPAAPPPAAASLKAQGREAYLRGDYAAAISSWTAAAQAGDNSAAYNLGVMALTGRGEPKDMAAAARWFGAAAKAGHPGAMLNYGLCLLNGYGVAKDPQGGVAWLQRAAEQNLPAAMALMGEVYLRGVGRPADQGQAIGWLTRAANAGDGPAMVKLGEIYEGGLAGAPDLAKAFALYRKAALAGQADAMVKVGYFYEDGSVEPADALQAATWYQRAADSGDPEGMASLAVMLESGKGVVQDEAAAAKYYLLAAAKNEPRGLLGIGVLYARGAGGMPRDDARAADYFRQASQAGSATATRNLAVFYEQGRGVPRDLRQARTLYAKAAAAGDTDAARDLERLSAQ